MVCPPDMFGQNECTPAMQVEYVYRQKNAEIGYQVDVPIDNDYLL